MRRLSGAFAYFAMLCTCSLAYGQPGFGQSDPAYGSVSPALTFANGVLSGSATFTATVPMDDLELNTFWSFYEVTNAQMGSEGEEEDLLPGQSATWTLSSSQSNASAGLHTLNATLCRCPFSSYDPIEGASAWIIFATGSATATVP